MKSLSVDFIDYPIIRMKVLGDFTVAEVRAYFSELCDELAQREGPFVIISETLPIPNSREVRTEFGYRSNDFNALFKARYKGSIIVVKSALTRMMMKGAMLLVKDAHLVKAVDTLEKAEALAGRRLAKETELL